MLQETEQKIAPVLYATNATQTASTEQWQALRLLAVQLHLRTNKAAELAKIPSRFMADQLITAAVKKGELPPPTGGWHADMIDFEGVSQNLVGLNLLACYFETTTLSCKLLKTPPGHFFITSDNPSIALNQFAADEKGVRDYIGFAQSGFQLVLPLSPSLCAFLYDPNVYKVGNRHDEIVVLRPADVEILNSLQIQSAERCAYAHLHAAEPEIRRLVTSHAMLRKPNSAAIKSFSQDERETLIMFSDPVLMLPKRWQFCSYLKNVRRSVGERRDPGFTHLVQKLINDIESNPSKMELDQRLEKIIAQLPPDKPIGVARNR